MPGPIPGASNFSAIVQNAWNVLREPAFKGLIKGAFRELGQDHVKMEDESVGDFISRRLGPGPVDNLLSAVYHGIYAGDVYQLSAKSLMPFQFDQEQKGKSFTEGFNEELGSKDKGMWVTNRDVETMNDLFGPNLQRWVSPEAREKHGIDMRGVSVFSFKNGMQQLSLTLADILRREAADKSAESMNITLKPQSQVSRVFFQQSGEQAQDHRIVCLLFYVLSLLQATTDPQIGRGSHTHLPPNLKSPTPSTHT